VSLYIPLWLHNIGLTQTENKVQLTGTTSHTFDVTDFPDSTRRLGFGAKGKVLQTRRYKLASLLINVAILITLTLVSTWWMIMSLGLSLAVMEASK